MSSTSIWVPISSAAAALFGAGLGAMLQGRYGVSSWRRQIRQEAYIGFLNAIHDFDTLLDKIINTIDKFNFDEKRQELEEAHDRLRRAGTLATVAGPRSIDTAAVSVARNTNAIMNDLDDRDAFISTAHAVRKDMRYQKRDDWFESAQQFTTVVRRILKTGR